MKREAEKIKVQMKFSGFQHQYTFYKTKMFESFFMKRKACFIDWWKVYDSSMIWSIISKLFLNFSFQRVSDSSLGSSASKANNIPAPPSFWKRGCGVGTAVSWSFNLSWKHCIGKVMGSMMFSEAFAKQNWCSSWQVELPQSCCKVWFASNLFPMQGKRLTFYHVFYVWRYGKAGARAGEPF